MKRSTLFLAWIATVFSAAQNAQIIRQENGDGLDVDFLDLEDINLYPIDGITPSSKSYYLRAKQNYRNGLLQEETIADAKKAIEFATDDTDLEEYHELLEEIYDDIDDEEKAKEEFREIVNLRESALENRHDRARLKYSNLDNEGAIKDLDRVIMINPRKRWVNFDLARAYFAQEQVEKAIEFANKEIELQESENSVHYYSYFDRAIYYNQQENFDLALKDIQKALLIHPNNLSKYHSGVKKRIFLNYWNNKVVEHFDTFPDEDAKQKLIKLSEDEQYELAQEYVQNKDLIDNIYPSYRHGVMKDIYQDLAGFKDAQYFKKADIALKYFIQDYKQYGNSSDPETPYWKTIYQNLKYFLKHGDKKYYNLALEAIDTLMKQHIDNKVPFANSLLYERATLKAQNGEYEEAIENFRKSATSLVTPEPAMLSALSCIGARRYEEAIKLLDVSIQGLEKGKYKGYNAKGIYRYRGIAKIKNGDIDGAFEDFSKEIKQNEYCRESRYLRAIINQSRGEEEKAKKDLRYVEFMNFLGSVATCAKIIVIITACQKFLEKPEPYIRPGWKEQINGFVKSQLRLIFNYEYMDDAEKEAVNLMDPAKTSQFLSKIIALSKEEKEKAISEMSFEEIISDSELENYEGDINQVKRLMKDIIEQFPPRLRQNNSENHIVNLCLARRRGNEINYSHGEKMNSELFEEVLREFDKDVPEAVSNIIKDLQEKDIAQNIMDTISEIIEVIEEKEKESKIPAPSPSSKNDALLLVEEERSEGRS